MRSRDRPCRWSGPAGQQRQPVERVGDDDIEIEGPGLLRLSDGEHVEREPEGADRGEEPSQPEDAPALGLYLTEFRLENQMPIWHCEAEGIILEKYLLLLYGQNTVHVGYHLLSAQDKVRLELRPSMHFRHHEQSVSEAMADDYRLCSQGDRMLMAHSVEGRFPFLDHRVVEFANSLPPRLKLRGLTEKYILRKAYQSGELHRGDTIVEASGAGTDTVMTSATYTLGSNLENLTLTGSSAIKGIAIRECVRWR